MKKADPKMRRLLWIIDFINLDIDKLERANFIKLIVELGEVFPYGRFSKTPRKEEMPKTPITEILFADDASYWRARVKETQVKIRRIFDKIFEMKEKGYPGERRADDSPIYEKIFSYKKELDVEVGAGEIAIQWDSGHPPLEYEISELIMACAPPGKFTPGFYSLENLKMCQAERCNHYFWQVHNKEKKFCSTKCAWRAYTSLRREEEKKSKSKQKGGK